MELDTYLHEYRHYHQSIGAPGCLCVVCIQLVVVVNKLNLETEELQENNIIQWMKYSVL